MEEEKYVSVRLEHLKFVDNWKGQVKHDFRIGKKPYYLKNIEPNITNIIGEEEHLKIIENINKIKSEYEKAKKRKMRKDGRIVTRGIITFSKKVNNFNNIEKFDECAKKFLEKFKKETGIKIVYLIRHNDEYKMHYHFMVTYFDNNFNSLRNFYRYKENMEKIQDWAGEIFKELGISRGKKLSRQKHKTVKELHKTWAEDLTREEIEKLKQQSIETIRKFGIMEIEKFNKDKYLKLLENLILKKNKEIIFSLIHKEEKKYTKKELDVAKKIIEKKYLKIIERINKKINNIKYLEERIKFLKLKKQKKEKEIKQAEQEKTYLDFRTEPDIE